MRELLSSGEEGVFVVIDGGWYGENLYWWIKPGCWNCGGLIGDNDDGMESFRGSFRRRRFRIVV
jgi:hypothetical protein